MILGIGTDICDIRRIEKSIEKFGERFIRRVFTEHEIAYCDHRSGKASCYGKRFAAKEAVAKALAGVKTGSLSWHEVEVQNDPSGRPVVHLYGKAEKRLKPFQNEKTQVKIHLSLTDDYPYAQAFAIVEVVDKADSDNG